MASCSVLSSVEDKTIEVLTALQSVVMDFFFLHTEFNSILFWVMLSLIPLSLILFRKSAVIFQRLWFPRIPEIRVIFQWLVLISMIIPFGWQIVHFLWSASSSIMKKAATIGLYGAVSKSEGAKALLFITVFHTVDRLNLDERLTMHDLMIFVCYTGFYVIWVNGKDFTESAEIPNV